MIACTIIFLALGFFSLQVSSELPTTKINSTDERCMEFRYYTLYHRSLSTDAECLGESYTYGHQILKFWDECSTEPENKFLPYEDSTWIFYKCIVLKSLGTQPLTLTSYAELMAGNMSDNTRSAILSILTTTQSQEEMESTTSAIGDLNSKSVLELGDIRKYWDRYFDAEFQVCSSTAKNYCNKTELDSMRASWKPQKVCKNGYVPKNLKDDYGTYEQFINCKNSLRDNHTSTNATQSDIRSAILHWCMTVPKLGMSGREDENNLLDFELLYNKYIVPRFYSKSIQENAFKIIRREFSMSYSTFKESIRKSKSLPEIVSYAAKGISELLRIQGHSEENLMFLTNYRILRNLVYRGENALSSICYRGLRRQ